MAATAGIAGEIIKQMVPAVKDVMASGCDSLAMVKWRGNLDYEILEKHGKVLFEGKNKEGGSIRVCKRDAAFIGAEHEITFKRDGNEVGKVHLCTYYNGSQSQAQLVFGDESFEQKTVTSGSSTCLILVYKPSGGTRAGRARATALTCVCSALALALALALAWSLSF